MSEVKRETRKLVHVLDEDEKEAYRAESSQLEGALWSVKRRAKRLLLEINGLQLDREGLVFARRFGLMETDEVDEWGGYRLEEVKEPGKVDTELLDVTCEVEERKELRSSVMNRKKVAEDRLVELSQALRAGKEEREVECEWRPRFGENRAELIRLDTYERLESRPLNDEERQQAFEWEKEHRAMAMCPICPLSVGVTAGKLDDHKLGTSFCLGGGLTTQQAAAMGGRLAEFEKLPDTDVLDAIRLEVVAATYEPGRAAIVGSTLQPSNDETEADAGDGEGDGSIGDSRADDGLEDGVADDPFFEAEMAAGFQDPSDTEEIVCPVCELLAEVETGVKPWPSLADHTGIAEMSPCVTSGLSEAQASTVAMFWAAAGKPLDTASLDELKQAAIDGVPYSQPITQPVEESFDPATELKRLLDEMKMAVGDLYPADAKNLMKAAGPYAEDIRIHLLEDQIGVDLKATTRRTLDKYRAK